MAFCKDCHKVYPGACPTHDGALSVVADKLDELVQAGSIPNLGSLMKMAKEKGLIKPVQGYADKPAGG